MTEPLNVDWTIVVVVIGWAASFIFGYFGGRAAQKEAGQRRHEDVMTGREVQMLKPESIKTAGTEPAELSEEGIAVIQEELRLYYERFPEAKAIRDRLDKIVEAAAVPSPPPPPENVVVNDWDREPRAKR